MVSVMQIEDPIFKFCDVSLMMLMRFIVQMID